MHLLLLLDGYTGVMSVPNLVMVSIDINIIVGKVVILYVINVVYVLFGKVK